MRGTKWAIGATAVLFAAVGLSRAAEDEYDLRGPAPKKGQVLYSKLVMKVKNADMTVKLMGQTLTLKQTLTMTTEEEEKLLAVDGRQVTKSQAKVIKDRVEIAADFMGQTMDSKEVNDLEGEVIVSERVGDGKWKHTLVDTKPTDKQKKELDKRIGPENDDELFPEGKVKVGHTWTVDAAAMKKFFGNSFTDVKGKLKQKFVKVEEVNGEPCAVIETAGPITAKMKDDDDDSDLAIALDLKATTWRELKTGVDVKAKFEGKIKISGVQKIDDFKADVVLTGPLTGEGTTVLK